MANYALEGWKWGDTKLGTSGGVVEWSFTSLNFSSQEQHYSFLNPHTDFRPDIRRAFDRWEAVTNIDFREVGDAFTNDIRVGFAPLDGAAGATLGEAWMYTWNTRPVTPDRMEIAFDSDEPWVWSNGRLVEQRSGASFYAVALHEIGHAIGLDHYNDQKAVMNSLISASITDLLPSDLAGIQALYGVKAAPSVVAPIATAGADTLIGTAGADTLNGRAGNDILSGKGGNDRLIGGTGKDTLTGSGGSDTFDFNTLKESVVGAQRDVIRDFVKGSDVLDLRTIDADTDGTANNQAFRWINSQAFSGVDGQLRMSGGILQGDTNGDRRADFEIKVNVNLVWNKDPLLSDLWL